MWHCDPETKDTPHYHGAFIPSTKSEANTQLTITVKGLCSNNLNALHHFKIETDL